MASWPPWARLGPLVAAVSAPHLFILSAPACPLAHTCALSRCHSRAQADVDLIATEMELDKAKAERTLREHKGDVVAALNALVTAA